MAQRPSGRGPRGGLLKGAAVDVEERLLALEALLAGSRPVSLSTAARRAREEALVLVREAIEALPVQLREARWVLEDRDEVLAQGRKEAQELLEQAYTERDRLVRESEVVAAAGREAERIVAEARQHARDLQVHAEQYVEGKLSAFAAALERTLASVERGREQLRADLFGGTLDLEDQPPA
jgi:cell division septum initiation protein DivIVA